MLEVRPISLNAARVWIKQRHRHLRKPIKGWLFGVEILRDGKRIGVACAARPNARELQDGVTCEISRVAVLEGERNACSFAYGALRKAARALGYQKVVTYTLAEEPGSSLRAAGFVNVSAVKGREWSCPSRPREQVELLADKQRWEWVATPAAETPRARQTPAR